MLKVLCLDDDLTIAKLLGVVVTNEGHEPLVETDAILALSKHLLDPEVACVICDYQMDNLTGIEVLAAFQERRPDVRRVLFTAFPRDAELSEALRTGVVEMLLPKPPHMSDLRAAVAWLHRG